MENYWKNLTYDIYYNIPCKLHKIANIFIFYNIKNLEIIYNFEKKDSEKIRTLLWTDYINGIYIEKIVLNDKELILSDIHKILENLPNENLQLNNKIVFYFSKTEDGKDEYLWFMYLVRYEVFEYEEDDFFREKTIQERKLCLLDLKQISDEFNKI